MGLADLKGYSVPFSPQGKAQIVGDLPWHFGVDIFAIHYRTDPAEIRKLIPEPLEPSKEDPGAAYVWFGDWQGIWGGWHDMLAINPERVQYQECLLGVRCSYNGIEGQRVVYIWVNKDFSMMRGWFMGFPKKFGSVHLGSSNRHLHALNPALKGVVPGMKYTAICEAHGERLITGTIELKEKITPKDLPKPFGTDLYHTIHFPSADVETSHKPLVHQIIQTVSKDLNFGEIWKCDGTMTFGESPLEEHCAIKPKEITGAYLIPVGFTIQGTKLIHTY